MTTQQEYDHLLRQARELVKLIWPQQDVTRPRIYRWMAQLHEVNKAMKQIAWSMEQRSPPRGANQNAPTYYDAVTSLATSSCLENDLEKGFYTTYASTVHVPFNVQSHLKRTAHRLAQEMLWCACSTYNLGVVHGSWIEGPEEVKLGWKELNDAFRNSFYLPSATGISVPDQRLHPGPNLNELRNVVCHPRHESTIVVDSRLFAAQQYAVNVLDDGRASRVRMLRDTLQKEAEKGYDELLRHQAEVETYRLLAELPSGPYSEDPSPLERWAVPHQRLFYDVAGAIVGQGRRKVLAKYGPVIFNAARAWNEKYLEPPNILRTPNEDFDSAKWDAEETAGPPLPGPEDSWVPDTTDPSLPALGDPWVSDTE